MRVFGRSERPLPSEWPRLRRACLIGSGLGRGDDLIRPKASEPCVSTHCHSTVLEQLYLEVGSLTSRRLTVEVGADCRSASGWSLGCALFIVQSVAVEPRLRPPLLSRSLASQAQPSLTRSRHQALRRIRLSRRRPPPGPDRRTFRANPVALPSLCRSSPRRSSARTLRRLRSQRAPGHGGRSAAIGRIKTSLAISGDFGPPWPSTA